MPAPLKLDGQTFGRLTVVERSHRQPGQSWKWRCRCTCGREVFVQGSLLVAGRTRSCASCSATASGIVHGQSRTPLFRRWQAMLARTGNPSNRGYRNYGGRGIGVCDRWRSFEAFAEDMAATFDPSLELDRVDVNGDYTPENCRWATRVQQQRNRRNNHQVTFAGRTQTVQDWGDLLGIKPNTVIYRLRRGWPVERALTEGANGDVLLEIANGDQP